MKTRKFILVLIILSSPFFLFPNSASATHYYVDNVGGNDGNSGTSTSAAWKTIAHVNSKMSQLVAGDVVSFKRGGTWTEELWINKGGTSSNPISFNSYGTGNKPIIRNTDPARSRVVYLGVDYIVIDGLTFRDNYCSGIQLKGNYCTIQNCEFTNTGYGVDCQGDHNLITKNHFHDLAMFYIGSSSFGCTGVVVKDTDNEISYNTFMNLVQPCSDYLYFGRCVDMFGQTSRTNVHHNYAFNVLGFMEMGATSGTNPTINDVRYEYNVSLECGRFSGIRNSGTYKVTPKNFKVLNNTIVATSACIIPTVKKYSAIDFDTTGSIGQYIFRNNIVYLDGFNRLAGGWTTFDHDHNLFYLINGTQQNITKHSTEITGSDPQFVSLSTKDLHLKSSSPARDKGVALGYSGTVDFDGNSVPYGSAPDIGAYEYVTSGTALSANASASPSSGQAPLAVSFTGSASGGSSPYTYSWAFGDGGSSTHRILLTFMNLLATLLQHLPSWKTQK